MPRKTVFKDKYGVKAKWLTIAENTPVSTVQCTQCFQPKMKMKMELIQQGWDEDTHVYILYCKKCAKTYAVKQVLRLEAE